MKHRTTLFLLFHVLLLSAAGVEEAKGNPASGQVSQAPAIPEIPVGNATPGALFSALEKIVDRVIGFYIPGFDTLPTIALEEITQAEFERYREADRPRLDPSLSRVQHTDITFTIPTAKARLVFNRDWDNRLTEDQVGYYYAKYGGHYPETDLYAVEVNGSAAIEWGVQLVIDAEANVVYFLSPIGDGPSGAHSASPGYTYLAYYDNQLVSYAETFIGLIRISGRPRHYRAYASYHARDYLVEDLVWISDHAFAVKFKIGKTGDDFTYFRSKDLRDLGK
jgi:hypothetical protein